MMAHVSQLKIHLASASPRRLALLQQVGIIAEAHPSHIDETRRRGEKTQDYVERMALSKAILCQTRDADLTIGADTVVILGKKIMGKPAGKKSARLMLSRLSGKEHRVMTGVAVCRHRDDRRLTRVVTTRVYFKRLSKQEIMDYVNTGEPLDKAGSYGIQGLGAFMVKKVCGSYSGVVGLPLYETMAMIARLA